MIHLDNNATTRPSPAVIDAMTHALSHAWHNPSSVHRAGQEARRVVELARAQVAALVNVRPRCVTFVSGGTESIDLSIRGVLSRVRDPERPPRVITSAIEHSAVRELLTDLRDRGEIELVHMPMDAQGVIDAAQAARDLRGTPAALMSVQWANNETGAIQPVAALTTLARELGAAMHVDATQWIGKEPTDLSLMDPSSPSQTGGTPGGAMLDSDLVTFSPHKFHGPKGVGVLVTRTGFRLRPMLHGVQEQGRRGGTENVPGIVGAGVAASEALAWLADAGVRERLASLRDRLETAVLARVPGSRINGPTARDARLWNTTNIAFPRLEAEALLLAMSERGLAASAGAACSSGSLDPSPVLLAMGVPPELAHGSVRFSLSRHTTSFDIDRAIEIIVASVSRLSGSTLLGPSHAQ
ncbi:MAG: cysteine desulfurase family protein [Phycisphaerales bacterium]|nr:cysteine desulfurase [Phycisphaeraceae bacterium]